jgi:predicted hydrolase (HD superfamily)
VRAVVSHGWPRFSHEKPTTLLERYLYAVDELTGLVAAAALVRPSRSVLDLTEKSVRKKWNAKAFAAGVDRGTIEEGAKLLGVELPALIDQVIQGMRTVAAEIGLEGTARQQVPGD